MITTNLTGNLGNHMWQYSVCRIVAEKLGYKWGVNPKPTHDYYKGMNQMYFMDIDFGSQEFESIDKIFHEKWINYPFEGENVNITMLDSKIWNIQDNTKILGHNGAFGGLFQSERYFEGAEDRVQSWFRIKPELKIQYENELKNNNIFLDDNTCVINFRGGEYKSIPKVLCRKEYWRDSINYMLSVNPKMKFIIISDDPILASSFMPFTIPSYHFDIGLDFYIVNNSKWTIISNSSFGWWAAWLNTISNKILAPRYFSCHNFSDGFWGLGESYTKKFFYVDRDAQVLDYETCKSDALKYYKLKNII